MGTQTAALTAPNSLYWEHLSLAACGLTWGDCMKYSNQGTAHMNSSQISGVDSHMIFFFFGGDGFLPSRLNLPSAGITYVHCTHVVF
jgi:hypothetical protein